MASSTWQMLKPVKVRSFELGWQVGKDAFPEHGVVKGVISFAEHNRSVECARMAAMLDPALGPKDRPVLILSCISHAGVERIPCVYVAHQLQLNRLKQPWMVAFFACFSKYLSFLPPFCIVKIIGI